MSYKNMKLLMKAVRNGKLETVQQLFEHVNFENDKTWFDYRLLLVALQRKHKDIVNFLLDRGCKVRQETKTDSGPTPLHYAVRLGDYDIVTKLLERGASILDKDNKQQTPFRIALQQQKFDIVDEMLLRYNFDDFEGVNNDNLVLYHVACMRGEKEIIQKFMPHFPVNSYADFGIKKWFGYTPLHFAVENRCRDTIHYLVKNNANVIAKNGQGLTPFHLAFDTCYSYTMNYTTTDALCFGCNKKYENPVDKKGISHFHICCIRGTPELIQFFLDKGVDVNQPTATNSLEFPGYYPLHIAVAYRQEIIVEQLLKHGACVNAKSKKGLTPLHLACHYGYFQMIKLLLKYNADIRIQDNKGRTPIHSAFYGQIKADLNIDFLLSVIEKDINYTDSQGLSLFHIACTRDNISVVEIFLKSGVSVNSHVKLKNGKEYHYYRRKQHFRLNDYAGYSALHFAADYNRKDVVLLLLQYGADVNIDLSKNIKIKPLHLACMHNKRKFYILDDIRENNSFNYLTNGNDQIETIKTLLNYKANLNAKDSSGKTPLVYACEIDIIECSQFNDNIKDEINNRLMNIIQILLDYGADIYICTSSGKTILHTISKQKYLKVNIKLAELFLSKGIDINAADEDGLTALHEAVKNSKHELVKFLLNHNADINATTKEDKTPLHLAIERANINVRNLTYQTSYELMVEILLAKGCDLNKPNIKGNTPLHMTFLLHKPLITLQLLNHGADINSKDTQGNPIVCTLYNISDFNMRLIILMHIMKLDALGLYINKKIRDYYSNIDIFTYLNDLNRDIPLECTNELKRMKYIKIDNYSSLYDILLKDQNEMANYVKNESLVAMVSSINIYKDFPWYSYLLKLQLKKGVARSALLTPAKDALDFITDLSWPNSCSEHILRYLTDENLENLIKAKYV